MSTPAGPGVSRDAGSGDAEVAAREGARANAEGRSPDENPYLLPKNMPAMTGEPLRQWARKNDAWREGFNEARRATAGAADRPHKQALPQALLTTMVNRRVRWLPEVRLALEGDSHAVLRVHRPVRHARDAQARNWDIDGFECGAVSAADCAEPFRAIVDRLRDEFDLR